MARSLWSGQISFGLINIPVSIVSAENAQESPGFNLIDKRDNGHIGYQKINKTTGKVVDNRYIVKGLKLDSGKYSIFSQDELDKLHLKGSDSIDLQQFVEQDDISPSFFEKPYFLLPGKGGLKTYVLLRETLKKTKKFGVGLLTMHSSQHLVLIGANGPALFLEIIRYQEALKTLKSYEFPADGLKSAKISDAELKMAERLVDDLTDKWNPSAFKDTFHEQLMKAVKKKKSVDVEDAPSKEEDEGTPKSSSKVLDLMPLLEKSLKNRKGKTRDRDRDHDKDKDAG